MELWLLNFPQTVAVRKLIIPLFLYISCKSGLLWEVALTVLPLPTLLLNQNTWGNMFHAQQRMALETWSPSILTFLTVATELPLCLMLSSGGVSEGAGISYLADRWRCLAVRWRCFVRVADHAGGRAEVTVLFPWSSVASVACNQL